MERSEWLRKFLKCFRKLPGSFSTKRCTSNTDGLFNFDGTTLGYGIFLVECLQIVYALNMKWQCKYLQACEQAWGCTLASYFVLDGTFTTFSVSRRFALKTRARARLVLVRFMHTTNAPANMLHCCCAHTNSHTCFTYVLIYPTKTRLCT